MPIELEPRLVIMVKSPGDDWEVAQEIGTSEWPSARYALSQFLLRVSKGLLGQGFEEDSDRFRWASERVLQHNADHVTVCGTHYSIATVNRTVHMED